jgi:Beta-lactamase
MQSRKQQVAASAGECATGHQRLAERKIANVDDRKRAMTVQHLLNMTSGFEWDEGFEGGRAQSLTDRGRSADWVQFILDRPMAQTPGELFSRTLAGPDLGYQLGVYTQDATDAPIRLDGPIGLDGFYRKGTPDEFGVRAARGRYAA